MEELFISRICFDESINRSDKDDIALITPRMHHHALEVLVKGLFFGYHLRSLGLPIFYNAISMNNNLKYIFFNIMQNSGFAGQKTKLG